MFIQAIFGMGYTREAFAIFAGAGTATDPWRAHSIGRPGAFFTFVDGDEGTSVFETDYTTNPTEWNPWGDLVRVKSKPLAFANGFPPSYVPLHPQGSHEGTIYGWFTFPTFGEEKYALVVVACRDGHDMWVFALANELELVEKNPHFA